MWKKLALGAAVVVTALLAFVALQPAAFAVERSAEVAAPADVVQARIENLRAMDEWSPWVKMDPQLAVHYTGPESGVGASSSWQGPQMGQGRLTVTAVRPGREVEMRLEMLAPMAATNRVIFRLSPAAQGTRVTWRMEGRNGFLGKAVALLADMDEMVGAPFEQGLASLATLAAADARGDG
jgi:hypothetical protein